MMKFCSHPDKLLSAHLKEVGISTKEFLVDKDIAPVGYIIGTMHDFGKYTTFFQRHLSGEELGAKAHHSFISALVTYYLLKKNDNKDFISLIAFIAVASHHKNLPDIKKYKSLNKADDTNSFNVDEGIRKEVVASFAQIQDILKNKTQIENELHKIDIEINIKEFSKNMQNVMKSIAKDIFFFSRIDNIGKGKCLIELYLLYSALIDADKRNAGNVSIVQRRAIPQDVVDQYRMDKFNLNSQEPINKLRNKIYNNVVSKVDKIPLNDHFFTITAPTGSGKTLCSISFALKLRDRIRREKGIMPRIIYSLPFISIIQQNYDVFRDVLNKKIEDFPQNESAYIIGHHHIASIQYVENNEKRSVDESLMLVESWDSEIIVTTFVQFLHSIIAYKNSFMKKFHNIRNSIILLDEVQNIPIEYWDLVKNSLNLLAKYLGCYIILLTATKPLIFSEEQHPIELVDNTEENFKKLERVRFSVNIKEIDMDTLTHKIISNWKFFSSVLIVMNTIHSSIELYKRIKEELKNKVCPYTNKKDFIQGKTPIFYLSSNIVPFQRRERIETMKDFLKRGIKPILVSTQVIEAGVDIDFDRVYRDIAPIDSIVQVAGRCNRNLKSSVSEGYIFMLDHLAQKVYGKVLPNISKTILKHREHLSEKEFFDVINVFFEQAKEYDAGDSSARIEKAMMDFDFDGGANSVSSFQLIDENGKETVFIQLNKRAETIWNEFKEKVLKEKDFLTRRINYLSMRSKINMYTVNVRKNLPPKDTHNVYFVARNQLSEYYDLETGYKAVGENSIW